MDDLVKVVFDEIEEVVDAWVDARRQHAASVAEADRAIRRAQTDLDRALRGVPPDRWRALLTGTLSLRDPHAARDVHRARRSKAGVKTAIARVAEARQTKKELVRLADQDLASAARRQKGYGRLGERLLATGQATRVSTGSGKGVKKDKSRVGRPRGQRSAATWRADPHMAGSRQPGSFR
jgi:hypothetical protein